MITVKTGLICVGLKGERNDLGKQFHEEAKKAFYDIGIEIVNPDSSFTLTGEDVRKQTEECRHMASCCSCGGCSARDKGSLWHLGNS